MASAGSSALHVSSSWARTSQARTYETADRRLAQYRYPKAMNRLLNTLECRRGENGWRRRSPDEDVVRVQDETEGA
jgi:hypothetical protein